MSDLDADLYGGSSGHSAFFLYALLTHLQTSTEMRKVTVKRMGNHRKMTYKIHHRRISHRLIHEKRKPPKIQNLRNRFLCLHHSLCHPTAKLLKHTLCPSLSPHIHLSRLRAYLPTKKRLRNITRHRLPVGKMATLLVIPNVPFDPLK
jgi:hypothetical protein